MLSHDHQLDPTGPEPAGTQPLLGDFGSEARIDEFDVGYDGAAESKQLAQQSGLIIGLVVVLAVAMLGGMHLFGSSEAEAAPATEIASIEDFIRKSQRPELVSSADPQHPDRIAAMFSDADRIVQKISVSFPEKRVPVTEIAKNPFSRPEAEEVAVEPDLDAAEEARLRQLAELEKEAARLNLQSIMGSGSRSVAVINGDFYRTGQAIGGFRVAGIDNGHVRLEPLGVDLRDGDRSFGLSIEAEVSAVPMQRF